VALAREVGAPRAEYLAIAVLGVDLAYLGRGDEGVAHLRQAVRLREASGTPHDLERAYTLLTDVLNLVGRPRESLGVASEGIDLARRYGVEHTTTVANQVEALLAIGEWDEADRVSAAALRAVLPSWSHARHLLRAAVEIGRGDVDAARSNLETARARVAPALAHGAETYDLLDAELALCEGRWADAEAIVHGGLARAGSLDAAHIRVQLAAQGLRAQAELAALARIHRDGDPLRDLFGRARGLRAEARRAADEAARVTPYAGGWRVLAEAEHERARGKARPDAWSEAAAAWDLLDRPPLAAYCRRRQAEALVWAGASRAAASVPLRTAHDVATRLGARPLLRELELLAGRAGLDLAAGEREHDIEDHRL
jgi:hypothetical protein